MRDEELVMMGFVRGAFGVKGWLKVRSDTEAQDSLFDYPTWWVGQPNQPWRPFVIETVEIRPQGLVAKWQGVDDRDAAEALKGMQIAVPRALMPEPEEDEYYWIDLIGRPIVNLDGESLGKVVRLLETGAHDVLVVNNGDEERLIPFVKQIVLRVEETQILVDWGLDYLR